MTWNRRPVCVECAVDSAFPARRYTARPIALMDEAGSMLMWIAWLVIALWRWLARWFGPTSPPRDAHPRRPYGVDSATCLSRLNRRKPDWVRREVIRIRAWSPHLGCRSIAEVFNRQLAATRRETVSKSYVVAFRGFGIPKIIRVDNEACFVSKTMRIALGLIGVRLQRTQVHCPWQNGRVERFFGTLKAAIAPMALIGRDDLAAKLIEFRAWYNHVRTHWHLGGKTPAEAWDRREKSVNEPIRFSAWDGELTGWHFPP